MWPHRQVNATTCPSALRATPSNDTSWDYCQERASTAGCQCANQWVDAAGRVYNGTCAAQADRLSPNSTTSWCPTTSVSSA